MLIIILFYFPLFIRILTARPIRLEIISLAAAFEVEIMFPIPLIIAILKYNYSKIGVLPLNRYMISGCYSLEGSARS